MSVLSELAVESCPFPTVDLENPSPPRSGLHFPGPKFCQKVFDKGECEGFYKALPPDGTRHQCPYGFSVWGTSLGTQLVAISGVVGTPRFNSAAERLRGKQAPSSHVDCRAVEAWTRSAGKLVEEGERERDLEFSRRLEPLHEIRKLNQIVKTNMERVCARESPDPNDPDGAPADYVRAFRASSLISVQLDALDMLAMSTSAPIPFNPRKWVFYKTVDKLVRIYRVLAESKGIALRLTGSSNKEVLIDQRTVHIIPSAFIDNAIKYSKPGGAVSVHVCDEVRDSSIVVTLSVTSEGPVATPEEQSRFFRTRGRGEAARKAAEGTGVGLALARAVADQHRAKVAASQEALSTSPGRSRWVFSCQVPVAM